MRKKTLVIVIAALIVIAAVLAVIVSGSMPKKEPCELIVSENGKQTKIDLNKLKLVDVKATVTRANGKTIDIDSKGIELRTLLEGKKYSSVTVSAEDNYSAGLSAEDIAKDRNVYVILGEENKPRLVVLSDTNAKRDVKNVLTIELID